MSEPLGKRKLDRTRWARLEDIFERHFASVYAYVAYRVAPDFDAATDITQETFLACFEGLSRYRGQASLLRWLRAIARNKVSDHFRDPSNRARQGGTVDLDALQANAGSVEARERALLVGTVMRR